VEEDKLETEEVNELAIDEADEDVELEVAIGSEIDLAELPPPPPHPTNRSTANAMKSARTVTKNINGSQLIICGSTTKILAREQPSEF
jgi:hypothetical protein